jgi:hypothetical protein
MGPNSGSTGNWVVLGTAGSGSGASGSSWAGCVAIRTFQKGLFAGSCGGASTCSHTGSCGACSGGEKPSPSFFGAGSLSCRLGSMS